MPVYAYRCENCGAHFERYQAYTEASLRVCPECHKKTLKKVISPVQVVFKGSGFYSTDNKTSSGGDGSKLTKRDEGNKEENKTDENKKDESKKDEAKKDEGKKDEKRKDQSKKTKPAESKSSTKTEKSE